MVRLTLLAVMHTLSMMLELSCFFIVFMSVLNVLSCLVNLVHISARVMTVN